MADVWVIMPRNNLVWFNGVGHGVDCSLVTDADIEHIQWEPARSRGVIQYDNSDTDEFRHNQTFASISSWQPILDAWQAAQDAAAAPKSPSPDIGRLNAGPTIAEMLSSPKGA